MTGDMGPSTLQSSRPWSLWLRVAGTVPSSGKGCSHSLSPPAASLHLGFHSHPVNRRLMSTFYVQVLGPGTGDSTASRQACSLKELPT